MQDKIICLVGPSGAGKTAIAKELEKEGYNIIHSYTNREPREPDEWGHTFLWEWYGCYTDGVFTGMEKPLFEGPGRTGYIDIDDMIAYFNDYDKDEVYFATYEQYQGKGTSIYIVDPNGAEQVKRNVKDAGVVTIFLMADTVTRYVRMQNRTMAMSSIAEEMKRRDEIKNRINKDKEVFKTCKCDYVIDANRELEEVVKDVIEIIEGEV